MPGHQTRERMICKTILYRLVGTLIAFSISYWFTGNIGISLGIGILSEGLETIFYYFHEYSWNQVNWGMIP
tara:strand:- start:1748 stop:1960 length:213 start_codon:yes stop_codon:yes gene_type:complete